MLGAYIYAAFLLSQVLSSVTKGRRNHLKELQYLYVNFLRGANKAITDNIFFEQYVRKALNSLVLIRQLNSKNVSS